DSRTSPSPRVIGWSCGAPITACGSYTRRTTTISRCCGKSCTGAKRQSGYGSKVLDPGRIPPPDKDPQVVRSMLRLLSIRNFAVIQSLELELDGGFTVLTGETGAGKSILLDALSLLLGDRFETRQLRAGADRAEVAADFDVRDNSALRGWLADQDLPCEGSLLLRRILDTQGRSRGYINGRPATLAQLKE